MSTATVDIEPMRWWHIAGVAGLERDLFPADAWSAEQFWQELALDTRYYIVARDDTEVVGYAGAFALAPDGDVQTIAVCIDRQGTGVASLLLTALIDELQRRGSMQVLLEVRSDNAPALALYERFGFERISQRLQYYPDGGDALIMRRRLVVSGATDGVSR